jgi:acyl carrier protein
MNEDLELEIKTMIIDVLNIDGVHPNDISSTEELFGNNGLSLDSIDALEIGVAIQKKYGIKISPEDKDLKANFRSVRTLSNFVAQSRTVGA